MTYTILHADDESAIRLFVESRIEHFLKLDEPAEILSAQDGLEAIAMYEDALRQGKKIDLVITDYNMPGANGEAVVKSIRKSSNTPIVLFCSEAEVYAKALNTEYAGKGSGISDLTGVIRKYCSRKPRILIVDDEADILDPIGKILNEKGYVTVLAKNAEQALPEIPSVHVVLSDTHQPNSMGGYGLLKEARERYTSKQLPFLLMTADAQIDAAMCLNYEAFPIQKPFDLEQLENLIRNSLPEHLKPGKAA
jgi:CheY-like chemotaxis protein